MNTGSDRPCDRVGDIKCIETVVPAEDGENPYNTQTADSYDRGDHRQNGIDEQPDRAVGNDFRICGVNAEKGLMNVFLIFCTVVLGGKDVGADGKADE